MYYYIYDQFLTENKYQSTLSKIENRLTDLEIKGKIGRLSLLTSAQELIENEIKKGARTVVAVGDDTTVSQVVNALAYHPQVSLGIIPLGPNLKIARTLGLTEGVEACNALAARIIKKIDLGKIKNSYFLSQLEIPNGAVRLYCDNKYIITVEKGGSVYIYNFNYWSDEHLANPNDGYLETVVPEIKKNVFKKIISSGSNNDTLLFNKKIKIEHIDQPVTMKIDSQKIIKTPVLVEVAGAQLQVIVGKNRLFK